MGQSHLGLYELSQGRRSREKTGSPQHKTSWTACVHLPTNPSIHLLCLPGVRQWGCNKGERHLAHGRYQWIFAALMTQVCALALLWLPFLTGGHLDFPYDRYYLAYFSPHLTEASQPAQKEYSSIVPTFLDLDPEFSHCQLFPFCPLPVYIIYPLPDPLFGPS